MILRRLQSLQLQLQDKDIDDEQVFVDCSNLLLEANIRRVPLSKDLEVCVRYRLTRYGMRNLVGTPVPSAAKKQSTVWKIYELFLGIKIQRIGDLGEHLDDEFLLRLRLIHSELLFMFGHGKIRHIPWSEMRLCLAVFLLIFKDEGKYGMFKLLLLPTELMVFLRATVVSLVEIDSGVSKRHQKVFRKLRKRHRQVEQLYGLIAIYWDVSAIHSEQIGSEVITEAALLQFVYKLHGVSTYTSSGSVNVIAKLSRELVESYRSALDSDSTDQQLTGLYRTLIRSFPLLKALLELALFLELRIAFRCFLHVAWNCQSFKHLKLLCRFLCDYEQISAQQKLYIQSTLDFYHSQVNQTKDGSLQHNLVEKLKFLETLCVVDLLSAHFNPSKFVFRCDNSVDLRGLKYLIQLDFATNLDQPINDSIRLLWSNLQPELSLLESTAVSVPLVWKIFQTNRLPFTYQDSSDQAELSRRFAKQVEAKFISKCEAYDEPVVEIFAILTKYSCSTVDGVVANVAHIPRHALMVLQRWMMQCYSYLGRISVNVNELALLQMGHERVYGHLLTDNASSRALTTDFGLDIVLRALTLTELSHAELSVPQPARSSEILGLSNIVDNGLNWLGMQKSLLESACSSDKKKFEDLVRQGAEPSGKFTLFLGQFDGLKVYSLETAVSYQSKESLRSFVEAFTLASRKVQELPIEFFTWDLLVDALIEAEDDPSLWNAQIFTAVVQKLVDCANVRSLRLLLNFDQLYTPDDSIIMKAPNSECKHVFSALISRRRNVSKSMNQAMVDTCLDRPVEQFPEEFGEDSYMKLLQMAIHVNNCGYVLMILNWSDSKTLLNLSVELSSRMNRFKILQLVLDRWKNLELNSALLEAALWKHWKVAAFLLSRGADPHAGRNTSTGWVTAFQIAIDERCLKFLKRCPVNIDQSQDLGLLTRAAKTGCIPMVRHLLRVGFSVLEESEFFPVAWANDHEYFQQLLLDTFQLKQWTSAADGLSRWHWWLEQWKFLPYLNHLTNCEVPTSEGDSYQRLLHFARRKVNLIQAVDRNWKVQSVVLDLGDSVKTTFAGHRIDRAFQHSCNKLQSVLEKDFPDAKPSKLELHFYSLLGESYAFVELTVYSACEVEQLEFFVEESSIQLPVIEGHIGKVCLLKDKKMPYSSSIRIFNAKGLERFELLCLGSFGCSARLQLLNSTVEKSEPLHESRLSIPMRSSDFETVQYLLRLVGKPEHEDLWLDPTLVHDLIDCCERKLFRKTQLLSTLSQAGIGFGIRHPATGLSAVAYAISRNQLELAKIMISLSCLELKESDKFNMIIQHGSIDVFELFLAMGNYTEEETFKLLSSALRELDVKCVILSKNLHTFLLFKLSEYGFSHLCSSLAVPKDPTEWIVSILFIIESVRKLAGRLDCEDLLGIDNEFLFQLRMLHKQMFFIKDKPHLKQIPLREMVFLLAIFLSSFRIPNDLAEVDDSFVIYRIVLNKLTLLKFLKLIAKHLQTFYDYFTKLTNRVSQLLNDIKTQKRDQLQSKWQEECSKDNSLPTLSQNIWDSLVSKRYAHLPPNTLISVVFSKEPIRYVPKLSKQDLRLQRRFIKLYHRVKQMYSLRKIYLVLTNISSTVDFRHMTVVLIKRFIQVFGEFTKYTANSRNLPNKTYSILNQLFHDSIKFNRQTRDISCHDYPLVRKLFPIGDQHDYYSFVRNYLKMVQASIGILLVCTYYDYQRCLFGSLRQCRNLAELQTLVRFIGSQPKFESDLGNCLEMVTNYNDELQQSLTEISAESLEPESQRALDRVKKNQIQRIEALRRLSEVIHSSFLYRYQDIQMVAYAATHIEPIRCMLDINLLSESYQSVMDLVKDNWNVLREDLVKVSLDIVEFSSYNMVVWLRNFDINEGSLQDHHSGEEVRKIVETFLGGLIVSASKKLLLESDLRSRLDQNGRGYFNNIFLIDSKQQAIKAVLKKHCKEGFERKLAEMRKQDIQELQVVLSEVQSSILKVLQRYGVSDIRSLVDNCLQVPQEALLAVEYWQLELCEILISTKQFQDNFYTFKWDLQLICGRNYRNYLAHDNLSYDLLTCSSRMKVLVNALVMAQHKWILFDAAKPASLEGFSDSNSEGIKWIEQQKQLSKSLMGFNVEKIRSAIKNGASAAGWFWQPIGVFAGVSPIRLVDMVRLNGTIQFPFIGANIRNAIALIDPTLPGRWNTASFERDSLEVTLNNGDFTGAMRHLNGQPWEYWLMSPVFPKSIFPCLGALLHYLDTEGLHVEILNIFKHFDSNILKALMCIESSRLVRFLVESMPPLVYHARRHAIFLRKPVDYLKNFIPDSVNSTSDLVAAVKANNLDMFLFLIRTRQCSSNDDLKSIVQTCARLGRTAMMDALLASLKISENILLAALEMAARHKRRKFVLLLFKHHAFPGKVPLSAVKTAIESGCLKTTKLFIDLAQDYTTNPDLLEKAAQFGSVRMVKIILRSGSDIWSSKDILMAAKNNKTDHRMAAFIESKLFEFKSFPNLNQNLNEWLRLTTECRIVNSLIESSSSGKGGLFVFFKNDIELVKRILTKVEQFGRTGDGCWMQNIRFFENNVESTQSFLKIDHHIQNLSGVTHEFQHRITVSGVLSSTYVIQGELTLIDPQSKNLQTLPTKFIFPEKPSAEDFYSYLINTIDEHTTCNAMIGDFDFECQLFRFCRMGKAHCLAEVKPQNGPPPLIKKLLNCTNSKGETLFHEFAPNGDMELLKFLLQNGANPATADNLGQAPLFNILGRTKSWDIHKHLLEHCTRNDLRNHRGVHVFNIPDAEGSTLLLSATYSKNIRAIEYLLEHGADQTAQNLKGVFPLFAAIVFRNTALVNLLLKHQPSVVNLRQSKGLQQTAIFAAIACNNVELVHTFLHAGADLSIRDSQGCTALARAIIKDKLYVGDSNVLQAMLEYMVGCSIGPEMDPEALVRLRTIMLSKKHTLTSFDAFELADHFKPYGKGHILLKCFELLYKCKELRTDRLSAWGPR